MFKFDKKDILANCISNIEFRWLRYRATKETRKYVEPISLRFPWLGAKIVEKEVMNHQPPRLQYRLFSEITKEWTGWADVPFVSEDDLEKMVTSNARLKAEYGELTDPMFKLDI